MPFTVTRVGMTDADFIWYSRRLSQQGANLGHLPRVLEPEAGRHWLAVWDGRGGAEAFAASLAACTDHADWQVVETNGVSDGPLGPVLIHVLRDGDGLTLATNQLSRAVLKGGFPLAVPTLSRAELSEADWLTYQAARGDLAELVREVAPLLTGLSLDELDLLGYAVLDDQTRHTLVAVSPAVPVGHP